MVENGVFLIADISGYTRYLARSDLRHGPVIATDLLTKVVEAMRSRFLVNKLEGDAVFSISTDPTLDGEGLVEVIEGTYLAFRNRLLSLSQATSCGCPSCDLVPRLDLKLIAHSGRFSRQRIAGKDELVGRDVIIAHRLLKNSLTVAGAGSGYMLVTDRCLNSLRIDRNAHHLIRHVEQYPHLGAITTWAGRLDLDSERQPWLPPITILHESHCLLPASPGMVWNALAPGRSDSCITHRLSELDEVVTWRPFEQLVVAVKTDEARLYHEMSLEQIEDRTRATLRWYPGRRRPHAPPWKEIAVRLASLTTENLERAQRRLRAED